MPCAVLPLLAADGLSWFERLERAIVHTITCDWHSEALGQVFLAAQSKLVPVLVVLALLGILALQDWRLALRALFTAGLGWLAAMLVADLMWATIDRPRPQEVFPVVLTAGSDQSGCASHPEVLALRSGGSTSRSFPSRHGLTVGVFALALWRARRWAGMLTALYGLLMCFGRLYSGKHWPSDLLAGVLLGVGLAWVVWRLYPPVGRWLRLWPAATPPPTAPPPAEDAGRVRG